LAPLAELIADGAKKRTQRSASITVVATIWRSLQRNLSEVVDLTRPSGGLAIWLRLREASSEPWTINAGKWGLSLLPASVELDPTARGISTWASQSG
jgi:DNA-binding transcriptional MocR family regulator